MVRSLESYDRSTWMEKEEISYKRLLDEETPFFLELKAVDRWAQCNTALAATVAEVHGGFA